MSGSVVQVEVVLYILTAISLHGSEPKEPLFEDGIASIPKGEREAEELVAVTDSRNSILPPAISFAAGLVMRQIVPRVAIRTVVFADGTP